MALKTLSLFCIILILLSGTVAAISVSPPRIILDDVLKGSSVRQSVLLSGIEHGSTVTVTLQGDGAEWISIPLGTQFSFPESETITLPFVLTVPEQAPNGDYRVNAQIIASPEPTTGEGNVAAVSTGILVEISFSVTGDEVRKYRVTHMSIPRFETGSPLTVVLTIDNDGNVIARPARVDVQVADKDRTTTLFSDSATPAKGVDAFSVGEISVSFDADLLPDLYFADITVHTDEGTLELTDIPFDVLEPGALDSSAELRELTVQENIDTIAKITGMVANTGDISFFARLEGEIYRDGSLVDTFETDESFVDEQSSADLPFFYTVDGDGTYTVKAHAEFLGKRTNEREISFSIDSPEQEIGDIEKYLFLTAILVIIAAYIIFSRTGRPAPAEQPRKRARKRKRARRAGAE